RPRRASTSSRTIVGGSASPEWDTLARHLRSGGARIWRDDPAGVHDMVGLGARQKEAAACVKGAIGNDEHRGDDKQYLHNLGAYRGPTAHDVTAFVRPTPSNFLLSAFIQRQTVFDHNTDPLAPGPVRDEPRPTSVAQGPNCRKERAHST